MTGVIKVRTETVQPGLWRVRLCAPKANILDADQHTDTAAGVFFQRIRFDLEDLRTDRTALEQGIRDAAERFSMSWVLSEEARRKRVAIFVSRYDHCLYDLLLRHRAGELRCEIPLIVSNHPDLKPVADQFGIDYRVFPISKENKRDQEEQDCQGERDNVRFHGTAMGRESTGDEWQLRSYVVPAARVKCPPLRG